MRKLIAIALLAVFGLPFAPSLLAMSTARDADVPACCRGNGAHHCLRRIPVVAPPGAATVSATCPYFPAAGAAALPHVDAWVPANAHPPKTVLRHSESPIALPAVRVLKADLGPQQLRGPPLSV